MSEGTSPSSNTGTLGSFFHHHEVRPSVFEDPTTSTVTSDRIITSPHLTFPTPETIPGYTSASSSNTATPKAANPGDFYSIAYQPDFSDQATQWHPAASNTPFQAITTPVAESSPTHEHPPDNLSPVTYQMLYAPRSTPPPSIPHYSVSQMSPYAVPSHQRSNYRVMPNGVFPSQIASHQTSAHYENHNGDYLFQNSAHQEHLHLSSTGQWDANFVTSDHLPYQTVSHQAPSYSLYQTAGPTIYSQSYQQPVSHQIPSHPLCDTASHQAVSQQAASQQAVSQQVASQQTASQQAASQNAASHRFCQTLSQQGASHPVQQITSQHATSVPVDQARSQLAASSPVHNQRQAHQDFYSLPDQSMSGRPCLGRAASIMPKLPNRQDSSSKTPSPQTSMTLFAPTPKSPRTLAEHARFDRISKFGPFPDKESATQSDEVHTQTCPSVISPSVGKHPVQTNGIQTQANPSIPTSLKTGSDKELGMSLQTSTKIRRQDLEALHPPASISYRSEDYLWPEVLLVVALRRHKGCNDSIVSEVLMAQRSTPQSIEATGFYDHLMDEKNGWKRYIDANTDARSQGGEARRADQAWRKWKKEPDRVAVR